MSLLSSTLGKGVMLSPCLEMPWEEGWAAAWGQTPTPLKHPPCIPCMTRGRVCSPLPYSELASWFSVQGLKKELILTVSCFISIFSLLCAAWGCSSCRYCTTPAAAGLCLCPPSHERRDFAGVDFVLWWAGPPELLGSMWVDAAGGCVPPCPRCLWCGSPALAGVPVVARI